MNNPTTFVLVHGGWAGGHVWDPLKRALESRGHAVVANDLPAHGEDQTPVAATLFDHYVQAVLDNLGTEPVVLVGHSMAGMIISQVAEQAPERVAKLVYVAAYLPQSGENMRDLGGLDSENILNQHLEFLPDYSGATIRREMLSAIMTADAPPDVQRLLADTHAPEPLAPLLTPTTLSPDRFGRVPKYYVHTLRDRAIFPQFQQWMVKRNGTVRQVFPLDAGHYVFLTQPTAVADILEQIART